MLNSKIRFIDDAFDKEKAAFLDLNINFDKVQVCPAYLRIGVSRNSAFYAFSCFSNKAKQKETQEQLTAKENLRMEIEMNMIKLIEQLK
jgi:hypothetical protein